jgi:uncharacterized protein (DUF1697 family)
MIRAMLLTGSRANANGAVDAFLDDDGQRLFRGGRRFMMILYLYTPDGFGTSKLAARAGRLLVIEATARNWRTVGTLFEMAKVSS